MSIHVAQDRLKEISTTTAIVSNDIDMHVCNGASDYVLTLFGHSDGKTVNITNINAGVVTLTPVSGTIFGDATFPLYQDETVVVTSDGTNYIIGG